MTSTGKDHDWPAIAHARCSNCGTGVYSPSETQLQSDYRKLSDQCHELQRQLRVVREHVNGLPDHPWIPGANFDAELREILIPPSKRNEGRPDQAGEDGYHDGWNDRRRQRPYNQTAGYIWPYGSERDAYVREYDTGWTEAWPWDEGR